MSCWVVPTIAAELWGMSVGQLLEQIRLGLVPSKEELGFLVVDMAPHSPRMGTGGRPAEPPPTYKIVEVEPEPVVMEEEEEIVLDEAEKRALLGMDEDDAPEVEEESAEPLNWRERRQLASAGRRPPTRKAA